MDDSRRATYLVDAGWLAGFFLLSSIWCLTASTQLSGTFDEPIYVARGLERWRTGSYAGFMRLGTMPLPVDVQTLPLYLWERWRGRPFDVDTELPLLLPWARVGMLWFWGLLLVYALRAGRALGGRWTGRLAVALIAAEPSFLAHAGLATTDVAVSACLLALAYQFVQGRVSGWGWRVGVPALWFAAAVLAKVSGLIFGVICLVVIEMFRIYEDARATAATDGRPFSWRDLTTTDWRPRSLTWRLATHDVAQIVTLGMVLVFVYCGSDWRAESSFITWARQLPAGIASSVMVPLAENLRVFSNAGEGIVKQVTHNVRGHGVYLLGHRDPRAVWYYFPVIMAIKLSVPLLLLPIVLLVTRPRTLWNWPCLAALALFAFSFLCRVQIGVRFMLPLVALAVVGLSAAVVQVAREAAPGWRRQLPGVLAMLGVLWSAGNAAACWPHGLCYVNELWGGSETGYLLVSDSNYDWGQGLTELVRWEKAQGRDDLRIVYFGSDPTLYHLPLLPLDIWKLHDEGPESVLPVLRGHQLAVSVSLLYGSIDSPPVRSVRALLENHPVLTRTSTFLIYDFSDPPPSASAAAKPAGVASTK